MLIALGLLRAATALEFVHPIVREAVYADMTGWNVPRRTRVPLRCCRGGRRPDERIAAQLLEASPSATLRGSSSCAAPPPTPSRGCPGTAAPPGSSVLWPSRRRPAPKGELLSS